MIAAAAAIHYHVTVMCGALPCTLPIRAQYSPGGGSPTPVPGTFTRIRLRIDPAPTTMPNVRWQSHNESVVVARFTSPLEGTLHFPGDTSATPEPDYLQTLLVPGKSGTTTVDAIIGAPVNETVSIPVYASAATPFKAAITYADPIVSTYGSSDILFTEVPWEKGAGGFIQTFPSVHVEITPQPYIKPAITWRIDGDSATISERNFGSGPLPVTDIRGVHPGTSTILAHVGAPVNQDISVSVVTYRTLLLPCRRGVRFTASGEVEYTTTAAQSDLFLDCGSLEIPNGAVFVTNGDDPKRNAASGAVRGPQFPDLGPALWRDAFHQVTMEQYRAAIAPCSIEQSPGIARIDYGCTTMPARTLLLRTMTGRYVKWLIQTGNGLDVLAGPYQVL